MVEGSEPITGLADADKRLFLEGIEDAEDRGLERLAKASKFAEQRGQSVETELLYGDPVTEITEYAEANQFNAIFVGHRGRSGRADLLLGSVAKAIVERAAIPVTVVH